MKQLRELCERNSRDREADTPSHYTWFHSSAVPAEDVLTYAFAVAEGCRVGREGLILGIATVYRYCAAADMLPSVLSVHRLVLTGMLLACKAYNDVRRSMSQFAARGGVPVKELLRLEWIMAEKLGFNLTVHADLFHAVGMGQFHSDIVHEGMATDDVPQRTCAVTPHLVMSQSTITGLPDGAPHQRGGAEAPSPQVNRDVPTADQQLLAADFATSIIPARECNGATTLHASERLEREMKVAPMIAAAATRLTATSLTSRCAGGAALRSRSSWSGACTAPNKMTAMAVQ